MSRLDIPKRRLWTPRPEVTMENYQEVFRFYDKYGGPNPTMTTIGHLLFSKIVVPRIDISPQNAEIISSALSRNAQAFLMMNHVTNKDQYNLASMAQLVAALHALRGRTAIMVKYGLFNEPGMRGKLQRYGIDAMGSLPTFRAKDLGAEADVAERTLQRNASDSSLQLGMNKSARDRLHMAGYPENERLQKGQDPTIVRRWSRGFGIMYENIDDDRELIVITAAHFSGEGDAMDTARPTISIGEPIVRKLESAKEFNEVGTANLQRDLTRAAEVHYDLAA